MALTYTELVALVRDWSNKDSTVLSDARIKDCLRYAADKAYRKLRVLPLENTITYTSASLLTATTSNSNLVPSKTELTIPSDLIEFIQIREIDANGQPTRVFNEKTDLRTFNDWTSNKYNYSAYWTRKGNSILLSPGFDSSNGADKLELHYYRRLPALNALYTVTPANWSAGLLDTSSQGVSGAVQIFVSTVNGVETPFATEAEATAAGSLQSSNYYVGKLAFNWLRDENERVILMGSLAEAFAYLQDDDQASKYLALFQNEIQELNDEDAKRNASGGNLQIHFNGRGLI